MASSFSGNQYDQAFDSKRLVNWERPKWYRRKPQPQEGFTQFVANGRGHLLPAVIRSPKSPWGTFVGTWDLPLRIPGNKMLDPMARTAESHYRNLEDKCSADTVIRGKLKVRRAAAGQPNYEQAAEGQPDLPPVTNPGQLSARAERITSPVVPVGLKPSSGPRLSPNVMSPKRMSASLERHMSRAQRMTPKMATPRATTPKAATPKPATPMRMSPNAPVAATPGRQPTPHYAPSKPATPAGLGVDQSAVI